MLLGNGDFENNDNRKKMLYLSTGSFILVCAINVIMYSFLPTNLYLNSFGRKTPIKKEIFLLILPLFSILGNYFCLRLNHRSKFNLILFNILMPVLTVFANLYSMQK